jgi:hypothetical protein
VFALAQMMGQDVPTNLNTSTQQKSNNKQFVLRGGVVMIPLAKSGHML